MPEKLAVLVLSSQAKNTGSTLRAFYLQKYLRHYAITDYIEPPFKSMPFMFDFILSLFYYFFALMNRRRYDYVVIVKPYPNTVIPALLLLRPRGTKIIIDVDDLDHGYRGGVLSGVIAIMQKLLLKTADHVTTHNTELMKMISEQHPKFKGKVYMLKQCVDHEVFVKKPAINTIAAKIKKDHEGKKVLFYTAHLNIACYLEDILQAFVPLKDTCVLIIGGGGPLLNHYKKMAHRMGLSDSVEFTGNIARGRIAAYIKAADICLVYYKDAPVNYYRASMKLREYLALSSNVVANSVGEIKDFKEFLLLSAPSAEAFALKLKQAVKMKLKENTKASAYIKKEYDWEKEAGKFFGWLKSSMLRQLR